MEITEVKVFPVSEEKLKAFVSVVFDRCFMVNDIKIIQGRDGLFVSMPSRKKKNGEFKDVAHPLNNETRRMIEMEVVDEYERVLAERGESLPAPPRTFPDPEEKEAEKAETEPTAGSNGRETAPHRPPERKPRPVAAASPASAADGGPPEKPAAEPRPAAAAADGSNGAAGDGDGRAGGKAHGSDKETEDKSLEEVQEMHLRDSFWSVS